MSSHIIQETQKNCKFLQEEMKILKFLEWHVRAGVEFILIFKYRIRVWHDILGIMISVNFWGKSCKFLDRSRVVFAQ